jgi:hypothetical protein
MDDTDEPKTLLFKLTSPEIFHCGFVMMTEPGGAYFDDDEAKSLRLYLQKGGFLWADDFWGERAWENWESMLRKALPSTTYPIHELSRDHIIFHQLMNAENVPQIPGIGYFERDGRTSERGAETATSHFRAIFDDKGRIMVLMTFNTDFGDAYERETEDPIYFQRFSVPGYAFGVNTLIYSMTH